MLTKGTLVARCPGCRSELPISCEQSLLLATGVPIWPFCPVCNRLVRAEASQPRPTNFSVYG